MKRYLYTYHHNNTEWSLIIHADSREDADARIKKIPMARYDGVLMFKILAYWWFQPIANLIIWWKNLGAEQK